MNQGFPRLAIHPRPGSFSDRWIEYCQDHGISYGLVNCYDNDIVSTLERYDALLWNWHHGDYRDVRAAPHVISAAEQLGLVVYPSSSTCRTFDNKLAQKYQLESIAAPLVPTYVFFEQQKCLDWLETATFPKVFKLSRGAGALNVRLVPNQSAARSVVKKAFGRGFVTSAGHVGENLQKLRSPTRVATDWFGKVRRLPTTLARIRSQNQMLGAEVGYVYFQDFIADLTGDTRIVIIGNRAFAFQRRVRQGDFRASGSGENICDPSKIDLDFVRIAFSISTRLRLQSAAYDFVRSREGTPYLLEVSYTFPAARQVKDCPGHWDVDLAWHEGAMWPQDGILEDVIAVATGRPITSQERA